MKKKSLFERLLPARATTQTWMMLTFALLIGVVVAGVSVYAITGLRSQIHDEARQALLEQARRMQVLLEDAPENIALQEWQRISYLTGFRIAFATPDSFLWGVDGQQVFSTGHFFEQPEVQQALKEGSGFALVRTPDGKLSLRAAIYDPETRRILQLTEEEPVLFAAVRRLELILIIGMSMAFLLALAGSWFAACQVTRPLKAITESARRINAGELDEEIRVQSRAAELQDLAETLNHMAEKFRKDIEDLKRMTQIQNEFIGNVSHEVRNPIFAVGGYLEALAMANLSPEKRQLYAEKGLANLQRLNNLFSDLIEIARLEYREDIVYPEEFDLQELLEEVADMVRPKADAKGLKLEIDNTPVTVWADRNRIRQVLVNLIDNAIAYTDDGYIRCRYRRRQNKVRIEVVDTGRGIPEEHLGRIFERFYRVDPARSRKEGGTGLGLSIVKQILQAHGETIHVESTVGRGTRFWFELPWGGSPEVQEKKRAAETEA